MDFSTDDLDEILGGDFDCLACGACCTHAGEVVVIPEDDTPKRLTTSVRNRIGFASYEADEGVRRMARTETDTCVALEQSSCGFRCRIYERRPAACRAFGVGSQGCIDAREAAGLD